MSPHRTFFAVVAAIVAVWLALGGARAQSGQHGDGHAEQHDIYKGWHPPGNPNTSCCNNDDCRPTRAYVDETGRWRVWNGHRWLAVPWERVLPTDHAGDGRSHLCERGEFIYCFTPASPRS